MDECLQGDRPAAPETTHAEMGSNPPREERTEPQATAPRSDLCLLFACLLALLWVFCVDEMSLLPTPMFMCFGGFGLSLSVIGFLVGALVLRGGPKGMGKGAQLLFGACMLLALVPALIANWQLRLLNAFVLGACCLLEYLLLSGAHENVVLSLTGCVRAVGFFLHEQLRNIGKILSLRPTHKSAGKTFRASALGLLAGLAVLMVVVPLMASADAVFAKLVEDVFFWLGSDAERWMLRVVRLVAAGLLAFSLLYAVSQGHGSRLKVRSDAPRHKASITSLSSLLALLDGVYLIFVVIQFAYLFGGTSSPAMYGGYAAYARSGFFQLVTVAAINLAVVLASLWLRQGAQRSIPLIVLQLVLLAATLVMLVSAGWRMSLYVSTFGLSLLRALTYLGMVAIAVLIILVVLNIMRSDLPFFRLAVAALVILWMSFMLCNPDARIASFNVDGYLSGSIETIDVGYLGSLSYETAPALQRLAAARPEYADAVRIQLDGFALERDAEPWSVRTVAQLLGQDVR